MSGYFITFEGGEGAGKSTLIESLFSHLKKEGRDVVLTRAPGGTKMGESVRDLLLHKQETPLKPKAELFLFLADRAQHVDEVILPALKQNQIVLCDRFNDSTVAYQGVGRGFGVEKVKELCAFATHNLSPNLTFYLDLDPAIGLERAKHKQTDDKIEDENLSFHQRIRTAFHTLAKLEPSRIRLIDATLSKENILSQVLSQLHATL